MMNMKLLSSGRERGRVCDLCHQHQACFYCCSDSAFLCSHCDSQVHSANFLVARHIRLSLCKSSSSYSYSSSSSSSSSSSTTSKSRRHTPKVKAKANNNNNNNNNNADWKTRDVLINWCRKLGLGVDEDDEVMMIEVAKHAFDVSWGLLVWPYRLGLAASLWFGVMKKINDDHKTITLKLLLKRLQEISGVPAKSIMLAQSKLLKIINNQQQHHHHHTHLQVEVEEGWAES